jgi:hypothetical protein
MKKYFQKKNQIDIDQKIKLTKNEKLTLVLSSFAILISLGQLFCTSPFFSDFLIKPDIYVDPKEYEFKDGNIISTFRIVNKGNKTAEDLIISLGCFQNDTVNVIPLSILDTTEKKVKKPYKKIIIKASRFVPNDNIYIRVITDTATFYNNQPYVDRLEAINHEKYSLAYLVPRINFVRFKDGLIKINNNYE